MNFPYTKFLERLPDGKQRTVLRPVIRIGLGYRGKVLPADYPALIDSGSDSCIFHAELAELLGLDVEAGEPTGFRGMGHGEVKGFLHDVNVIVGGHPFPCRAAFSYGLIKRHPDTGRWEGLQYGVLGQQGFFNHFRVEFNLSKERIELKPLI